MSIIVRVAQRDLRILSDEILGSKVELPRGEEGRKNEDTTQNGSPQHGWSYVRKLVLQERSPV
jgi:hypothetical protein